MKAKGPQKIRIFFLLDQKGKKFRYPIEVDPWPLEEEEPRKNPPQIEVDEHNME